VSSTEGAYSRLPSKMEVVSRYYHIHSSKKLNTTVTLKIFHRAAVSNLHQLCFLTSTDKSPPYNYNLLRGGHFTPTYGEITVETFSFYTICKLYIYHGVKGVLSYMETTYRAALYRSIHPTRLDSGYRWNVYLYVMKNCEVFTTCMKEYREHVKLLSEHAMSFDDTEAPVRACVRFEASSPANVFLDEPESNVICKTEISEYVEGKPPLLVYRLCAQPQSFVELRILLQGFEKDLSFILRHRDLPGEISVYCVFRCYYNKCSLHCIVLLIIRVVLWFNFFYHFFDTITMSR